MPADWSVRSAAVPCCPKSADGSRPVAKSGPQDWSGGDLDDLIAILSGPALSARVEVLGASGDTAVGEVHLLAGGVSDALYGGKSTDDALDKLRAGKPTRFRVEQRLPNPTDGDLTYPGADAGTLEGRALAHLMRYCEDYVITCAIEVWRGNENARVDYKRGEINGVTVGGIDAPERLAEVMQWSSGNYRLIVPPLKLPAVAPKRPQAAGRRAREGAGARAVRAGGAPRERDQDHLRHARRGDHQGARRRRGREARAARPAPLRRAPTAPTSAAAPPRRRRRLLPSGARHPRPAPAPPRRARRPPPRR